MVSLFVFLVLSYLHALMLPSAGNLIVSKLCYAVNEPNWLFRDILIMLIFCYHFYRDE